MSFFTRVWPLSFRKIQFRRTVESEVDPGKQATENPTVAHYIRFVGGFETEDSPYRNNWRSEKFQNATLSWKIRMYARHGRDKFLELLIDSFSKLNRRDFDRPSLISTVPRSPWKLSVSTATKNTSWRDVRCSYSGDRQTGKPRKSSVDPRLRRYSYAVDATCDLSSR